LLAREDASLDSDTSFLATPSRAVVENREEGSELEFYQVLLSPVRVISGRLAPRRSRKLQGLVVRITYRFPHSLTLEEVFAQINGQIDALAGAGSGYQCMGIVCGRSNHWANIVFNDKILYGKDAWQYYRAVPIDTRGWLVLYVVRRGNNRVYARVDSVRLVQQHATEGKKPDFVLLWQGDSATAELEVAPERIRELRRKLMARTVSKLILVGHVYRGQQDVRSSIETGRKLAQAVGRQLEDRLPGAIGIEFHGVGPLAPEAGLDDRVVAVLVVTDDDR